MENPFTYFAIGNLLVIDLIAAGTNALNGALLARNPSHYRGNYWSVVGILLLAIFGGIGGGVLRDVMLAQVPAALSNPWYIYVCLIAGTIGMYAAYNRGQQFRDRAFQLMTAFSLPWYAVVGVQKGLDQTYRAGRYLPWHGRSDCGSLPHRHHLPPTSQTVRAGRVVRDGGRADRSGVSHLRTSSGFRSGRRP